MIAKVAMFILSIVGSIGSGSSIFYLYDKIHNRAVEYNFADTGNIYYTSQNFHSIEYFPHNKTENNTKCLFARKVNSSKSMPVMRLA
jgi:hypothetical protein